MRNKKSFGRSREKKRENSRIDAESVRAGREGDADEQIIQV